ncbi:metallophosphoesterase [Natrialbaceae archaeon AArc-T1-2]|uniref:metallophosphoesterase n=1 Tax=Natrialbaceae archaeon AArc-T1-2 TaxID=3053904 RepID=UPI00255B3479|nr:metallophosphoesterase [Natrialbaceae archaeon AArc-T1-2]WIV66862.1 metallophosphoesterase [Natrialbaceae archaeon AArc-T1-2]
MTTIDVDVPFSVANRAVYVPDADALVVADAHLGRAAASAVDAPIADGSDVLARLEDALERFDPATVVVAGDLLHSFSRVPRGVSESVADLEAAVSRTGASLVVTPGNHDTMLEDVYDGETTADYRLSDDETVVTHGHERPDLEARRYVIGHVHPALSIDGRKRPCLLYGPDTYEGADVVVVPAITRLASGMTVNTVSGRDIHSPLVTAIDDFHPVVRDPDSEESLWFPPLGACRHLL